MLHLVDDPVIAYLCLHKKNHLVYTSSLFLKAAADNVPEGISVCISSLRPSDVLQSSELHRECLFILQRQGAMNIKCDDTWNKATKRSTLLDLRTIHHGATKLSAEQGSYSLLQQTIPSGILPVYDMMDDKRNVGKLCFEEFNLIPYFFIRNNGYVRTFKS